MANLNSTSLFQTQFLNAITELCSTKNISSNDIVTILSDSIKKALLKEDPEIRLDVSINLELGTLKISRLLKIVEQETDDFDDINEITLDEARKILPNAKIGDEFYKEISLANKNDISKQTVQYILQLFKQKITELTNKTVVAEWLPRVGEVIFAEVEKKDDRNGSYIINLETTSGYLQRSETIRGENLQPGKKYWFVIKEAKEQSRGWPIILSRADERLLQYLLTTNIPEIEDKTIEIKKIVRATGQKSKVAVISNKKGFDPIGAIIGKNGDKIKFISSQINNELIDVLIWSDDEKQTVVNAIYPIPVVGINIIENSDREKSMEIFVSNENLPNVIGRNGINVKLLAKLIGWNIDIKSVSQATEENIEIQKINYIPQSSTILLDRFNNINRKKEQRMRNTQHNNDSNIYGNKNDLSINNVDLVSYSTKQIDMDEIVVDLDATMDKNENESLINEKHNENNKILEDKSNFATELNNEIDISVIPKRQVKELKIQNNEIKKKNNKNKKKSQRKVIDDFSLLDSEVSNDNIQNSILIDDDDDE